MVKANNAVEASKRTHEVVWVKMYPDGTTAIDEFKPEDEQPVYVRTVNSGLSKYVESRFQVHAETIKRDYAEAGVFLGETLFNQFTEKQGLTLRIKLQKLRLILLLSLGLMCLMSDLTITIRLRGISLVRRNL